MKKMIIGIKEFRQKITILAKSAKLHDVHFIVTVRNKPVFEVRPILNAQLEPDNLQMNFYKSIEETLSFWQDKQDDDIFKIG